MNVPRVKICGITREEDAVFAASAGADAIGIVFYPPSKRYVADLGLARAIAQSVGAMVNVVALFVDAGPAQIEEVLTHVNIHTIQFHGDESPESCALYRRPYIKALRVRNGDRPEQQAKAYAQASGVLLDTYVEGQPGGTGLSFNWGMFPRHSSQGFILAGGLSPENVKHAIAVTKPYAVDVSGGVEQAPGIKDHQKIMHFIRQAKLLESGGMSAVNEPGSEV